MKNLSVLLISLLFSSIIFAQELITLKAGESIPQFKYYTMKGEEKDSKDFTAEELAELENMPCFYLDEFELDINKYYEESLEATLLNENEKYTFYDVQFKFSTSSGKEVA